MEPRSGLAPWSTYARERGFEGAEQELDRVFALATPEAKLLKRLFVLNDRGTPAHESDLIYLTEARDPLLHHPLQTIELIRAALEALPKDQAKARSSAITLVSDCVRAASAEDESVIRDRAKELLLTRALASGGTEFEPLMALSGYLRLEAQAPAREDAIERVRRTGGSDAFKRELESLLASNPPQ